MANFAHITLGKAATALALISIISAVSLAQVSRVQSTGLSQQTELSDLLCRIDRRCPTGDAIARRLSAPAAVADLTPTSDLRGLLCRIDRRCPTLGAVAHEASKVQIAENTAH